MAAARKAAKEAADLKLNSFLGTVAGGVAAVCMFKDHAVDRPPFISESSHYPPTNPGFPTTTPPSLLTYSSPHHRHQAATFLEEVVEAVEEAEEEVEEAVEEGASEATAAEAMEEAMEEVMEEATVEDVAKDVAVTEGQDQEAVEAEDEEAVEKVEALEPVQVAEEKPAAPAAPKPSPRPPPRQKFGSFKVSMRR